MFQPKRPYNRKTQMTDAESASSSQEITEVDGTEFSLSEKPSVPPSPESSCSTEIMDPTPREGSPATPEASEDTGEVGIQGEECAPGGKDLELSSDEDTKGNDTAAEESLPAAAEESLVAAAEESLSAEGSLIASSVGVEDSLVDAAEEPSTAAVPDNAVTPDEEAVSGEAASSAIESPSGQETPDPPNKESSADDTAASNLEDPSKPDDSSDDKTPPDSATPSPTNEDDDSSLSPSDLIETETYNIPSTIDLPGDLPSQAAANPPGKQSSKFLERLCFERNVFCKPQFCLTYLVLTNHLHGLCTFYSVCIFDVA